MRPRAKCELGILVPIDLKQFAWLNATDKVSEYAGAKTRRARTIESKKRENINERAQEFKKLRTRIIFPGSSDVPFFGKIQEQN